MNRIIQIFLVSFAFTFGGCLKGPQQEIPFRVYVTVPGGINPMLTHNFVINNIPGVGALNIIEAQPAYVRLYVEDGEYSADFIRQAFFEATTDSSRNEVAYNLDIPVTNSRNVDLYPSIFDMKDHITNGDFQMTLKLNLRSIPVTDTRIQIDFGILATLGE